MCASRPTGRIPTIALNAFFHSAGPQLLSSQQTARWAVSWAGLLDASSHPTNITYELSSSALEVEEQVRHVWAPDDINFTSVTSNVTSLKPPWYKHTCTAVASAGSTSCCGYRILGHCVSVQPRTPLLCEALLVAISIMHHACCTHDCHS